MWLMRPRAPACGAMRSAGICVILGQVRYGCCGQKRQHEAPCSLLATVSYWDKSDVAHAAKSTSMWRYAVC
jgi:hypothetical protein